MEENTRRMLNGQPYRPDSPELDAFHEIAHRL